MAPPITASVPSMRKFPRSTTFMTSMKPQVASAVARTANMSYLLRSLAGPVAQAATTGPGGPSFAHTSWSLRRRRSATPDRWFDAHRGEPSGRGAPQPCVSKFEVRRSKHDRGHYPVVLPEAAGSLEPVALEHRDRAVVQEGCRHRPIVDVFSEAFHGSSRRRSISRSAPSSAAAATPPRPRSTLSTQPRRRLPAVGAAFVAIDLKCEYHVSCRT